MRDGKSVAEWADEASLLLGEYGQKTARGVVANQCNRVASRLRASVSDTLSERDDLYEALRSIAEFKADPTRALAPYEQISVFAKQTARAALAKVSPQADGAKDSETKSND